MAEPRSGASESCQGDRRGEVTVEVGDIHQKEDAERASCPGEIPETDLEQAVAAKGNETIGCFVSNDLRVAAELQLGRSGWQVIYPEAQLKLAMHSVEDTLQVSVRLRDDVKVCGMCTAVQGCTLMLSRDFGDFGDRARRHIRNENIAAEQESLLQKQRKREINQQLNEEVTGAILWRQKWVIISISGCILILVAGMVTCTLAAFSATELQSVGLSVALLGFSSCACWALAGIAIAGDDKKDKQKMREAVQAAHPELQQFEDTGFEARDCDWKDLTFASCFCCIPLVVLGCMVAMTAASDLNGYGWALAVLWGSVALLMCCGGVYGGWVAKGVNWGRRAGAFLFGAWLALWPVCLLGISGFASRLTALLLKPPKRLLDAAIHSTHEHTIVFEGNVLPGRETVCSWPGKYATAWDALVAGSKEDGISAAVVFLPEGSKHFGLHDPIPASQDLRDLHGECWCTPLYGERKPWGCRWWSKWIANIERAVTTGCTLEVYYFNGMRGKGKVKDFSTAGEEHLRREAIERYKDTFLKSEGFRNALEAGLEHLPKENGPDSSSPYSREVRRLFLARLPEEDRQFLVSSEGLGNSQKAEVAWLERKGYPYIEKEVWELESSSPKAIGRAVTP